MRIWLAGSRAFGSAVYNELNRLSGVKIVAVTCPLRPDDPLTNQALHGPENTLVGPLADQYVVSERIDLIVCAQHYSHVSAEAREAATHGAIGYHPSLLPRHRGPSAVEWTITMGDPIAGGTVYQMDDGYDTGPIITQDWCHVYSNWTAKDLWKEQLFPMGVRLLMSAVHRYLNMGVTRDGQVPMMKMQDERFATVEPKYTPEAARSYELGYGAALGAI